MQKIVVILFLVVSYAAYSLWVYTYGTNNDTNMSVSAIRGKALWQQKNCQNCHQLFGLGGYMGPDLTNVISDTHRGPLYARGIIVAGGSRMPNFHLADDQVNDLIAWLEYAGRTTKTVYR